MKKILTITLLVLLTVGLFVACNADASGKLFQKQENPPSPPVPVTYKVTFEMQKHGTQIDSIIGLAYGSKISAPEAPKEDHCAFGGWYKELECTTPWNFDTDEITSDTKLYARWLKGFVDLGVKDSNGKTLYWAECNLGANNPQDPGDYYMWGATALMYSNVDYSKTNDVFTFITANPYGDNYKNTWYGAKGFEWDNIPFADGVYADSGTSTNKKVFTKYTSSSDYANSGSPDNLKTLEKEDDAATAENQVSRIPTKDDFVALAASCVWVWTSNYEEGKTGYIVYKAKNEADKGKVDRDGTWQKWNGSAYVNDVGTTEIYSNSDTHIFLPAAGYGSTTKLCNVNSNGGYWTSSLDTSNNRKALTLSFTSSAIGFGGNDRRNGYPIRPVAE